MDHQTSFKDCMSRVRVVAAEKMLIKGGDDVFYQSGYATDLNK